MGRAAPDYERKKAMADAKQAIKVLIDTMTNSSRTVSIRSAAADGLGFAGGDDARKALIKVLENSSNAGDLRAAAARAIGRAARN